MYVHAVRPGRMLTRDLFAGANILV